MQTAYSQYEFDIKLEWGLKGIETLGPVSDVIIVVDILSFSTCVDIAIGRGAVVFPYQWRDNTAIDYAHKLGAVLADHKRKFADGYSLSPTSLLFIPRDTKLVLPSPNGSALTLATGAIPTLCGSLRNAKSVANYASSLGSRISIIAAGERWPDGSLRPSLEDLIGAGAIISFLSGSLSPESHAALAIYQSRQANLLDTVRSCSSGKELVERGFSKDIDLACDFNISDRVPVFKNDHYIGLQDVV
jgi:2-phosphosulfolactate phosphatase